jgi:hypothetical protein
LNALIPHPSDFAHASRTHGQGHVARVMVHAFRLIEATGLADEGSRLWGAVYLHDLARTHDGFCEVHGMHAVMRVNESTDLQERLIAHGAQSDDPSMLLAVMMHCLPDDHSAYGGKPIWPLLSLLKDADALDRVRFGDLEPAYLRHAATREMVQFAQDLYNQTRRIKEGPNHFSDVVRVAEKILGKPLTVPPTVLQSPAMKGKRNFQFSQPVQKGGKPGKADKVAVKGAGKVPLKPVKPEAPPAKGLPPKNAKEGKNVKDGKNVKNLKPADAGRTAARPTAARPAKAAAKSAPKAKARRRVSAAR